MSSSIKPWSTQRQVLWALGVFGLVFWILAVLWALVIGGFGPGKQVPRAGLADLPWLCLPTVPCFYYIVVAHRVWTRRLWRAGAVMHVLMIIVFVASVALTRGDTLVLLPFLLIGPLTWILHAKRNPLTEMSG